VAAVELVVLSVILVVQEAVALLLDTHYQSL